MHMASCAATGGAALLIRQETNAGEPAHAAAGIRPALVVAGDPDPGAGPVDLVSAQATVPGVKAGGAGGILPQGPARGAGGEPAQARCRDRALARVVAAVLVVGPALVAAGVDGGGVGRHRVERVAAGVVDPLVAEPAVPGPREGRDHVAQPGEREDRKSTRLNSSHLGI